MGFPEARPTTYEDLSALPEHIVGEIINDDDAVSPPPFDAISFSPGWAE